MPVPRTAWTASYLNRLLPHGLGTNEILGRLGKPDNVLSLDSGEERWSYGIPPRPAENPAMQAYIVATALSITNGCLAYWGFAYYGPEHNSHAQIIPPAKDTPDMGTSRVPGETRPSLQLFVVSSEPVDGGRFIDTERLPKLGYIGQKADADFTKLHEVTVEESKRLQPNGNQAVVWSFGIILMPDDEKRLTSLTETNISKRLLIMVGNRPITAPEIRAPLETGSFLLDCDDGALAEFLKKQLAQMQ